jgi:hypothetical protein
MEYQEITPSTHTLYLIKQSMFDGEYLLTDHTDNFGKLVYDGLGRETGLAYSAGKSWKFDYDFEPFGKREILIYDHNNNLIGNATIHYGRLADPPVLTMNDGFTATFSDVAVFSHEYGWISPKLGSLIHIKSPTFSLTDIITIIRKDLPENMTPLLCFLAEHILILQNRGSRGNIH